MCESNCCCQKPEKLIGTPQDCTPEQIRECHGERPDHPCVKPDPNNKQKATQ